MMKPIYVNHGQIEADSIKAEDIRFLDRDLFPVIHSFHIDESGRLVSTWSSLNVNDGEISEVDRPIAKSSIELGMIALQDGSSRWIRDDLERRAFGK